MNEKQIPQICIDLVNEYGLEACLGMIPNRGTTNILKTRLAIAKLYVWGHNHPDARKIPVGKIRDGFEQLEYNLNENRKKIEGLYQNG